MKILAADTSTKITSIALMDNDKPLAQLHKAHSRSQGSALIHIIEKMLRRANVDIKEIDLLAVGIGPGSFTGLRTSLAAMRSLSIALKKPIIGISSFDVIANHQAGDSKEVGVLVDARQNKIYARFYKQTSGVLEPITPFLLDRQENILNKIKNATIIAGDAINVYKKEMLETAKDKISFAKEDLWYPKADILAAQALDKYKKGHSDDPFKLLPLYIYSKECQIKTKKS